MLKFIGKLGDCDKAKARIRHCIVSKILSVLMMFSNNFMFFNIHYFQAFDKQKTLKHEYGGDKHFVCFAYENENETFRLKPCVSAPKFDDFIQRERYRIETESDIDDDGDDDDDDEV